MSVRTILRKFTASSLALLLVSCSTTSPVVATHGPSGPRDLGRFVLVIEETSDGRVTHAWKPLEDFDLNEHSYPLAGHRGALQRTSTPMDDEQIGDVCERVWSLCMEMCLKSPLPPHASHYLASRKSMRAALGAFCTDECARERDSCRKELERAARETIEFPRIDDAVDWLKRHKEEIAVGAVVIIAGVTFCAVVGSGGGLILVPVLLLASPNQLSIPSLAEASR